MSRFLMGLTGLFLLALMLRFGIWEYSQAWEDAGDRMLRETRIHLLAKHDREGQFPDDFTQESPRVWGLSGPSLRYFRYKDGCRILFYLWPLGPHQGIDCITGEQLHEE